MTQAHRRRFLLGAAALGVTVPTFSWAAEPEAAFAASPFRKITEADWRKRLPTQSFEVLRHEGTERPFSSPLLNEHRKGVFVCLGCDLPLFKSEWKFDSGTGWPSFFTAIEKNLGHKRDFTIIEERDEYHCARCLGHQGHLFHDGPQPTGLRYCNNGVAFKFTPA